MKVRWTSYGLDSTANLQNATNGTVRHRSTTHVSRDPARQAPGSAVPPRVKRHILTGGARSHPSASTLLIFPECLIPPVASGPREGTIPIARPRPSAAALHGVVVASSASPLLPALLGGKSFRSSCSCPLYLSSWHGPVLCRRHPGPPIAALHRRSLCSAYSTFRLSLLGVHCNASSYFPQLQNSITSLTSFFPPKFVKGVSLWKC